LNFPERDIRKILKYQISWKSVLWEPSSTRTDRQTDERTYRHDRANSRFSKFFWTRLKTMLLFVMLPMFPVDWTVT